MQKNLNTNYKKKVFLIDIDNTICRTKGSNYSKSVPKKHIIKSINLLKKKGHYIKIYTARYMNRSNQDAENVNAKYYKKTFSQLVSWNVRFDELIMGKPSSDFIIDDRSFNPLKENFSKFSKNFL
jgi:capsule biosynthesis phosphatase